MSVSTHEPVFIRRRDVPLVEVEGDPTVYQMCIAAERCSGAKTICGAQPYKGMWRIYPKSEEARTTLLIEGIIIRNVRVSLSANNPFIPRDDNGVAVPTTRVWIDQIPLSVADSEIEFSLRQLGCDLKSRIMLEKARDNDRRLTNFLTGRRFVFITVPPKPLPKWMPVAGDFQAKLFHWEQKEGRQHCTRCLTQGHNFSQCNNDIVCRVCTMSGHRSGAPECPGKPYYADESAEEDGTGQAPASSSTGRAGGAQPAAGPTTEGTATVDAPASYASVTGGTDTSGNSTAATTATAAMPSAGGEGQERGRRRSRESQKTLTGMALHLIREKGKDRSSSKRRQSSSPGGDTRSPKAAKRTRGKNGGKGEEGKKGREKEEEKGSGYSTDEAEFEQGGDNLEDGAGEKWG